MVLIPILAPYQKGKAKMNGPTSTPLVLTAASAGKKQKAGGCSEAGSFLSGRRKWFVIAAALIAAAAVAFGSALLGFAAVLPLLFLLPCLVMAAMCVRGHGKGGANRQYF
jgi:cystathionine beta-lyase family protein involved in aluminum resistance